MIETSAPLHKTLVKTLSEDHWLADSFLIQVNFLKNRFFRVALGKPTPLGSFGRRGRYALNPEWLVTTELLPSVRYRLPVSAWSGLPGDCDRVFT